MKLLMIGTIEKSGGVSTHTRMLIKEIKNLNVEIAFYNLSLSNNYPRFLNILAKLYKKTIGMTLKILFSYKKYNIIHIQSSGPMGGFIPAVTATLLKIIFNYNLYITFHHGNSEVFADKYNLIIRHVILRCNKFIVVSKLQKQQIISAIGSKYADKIVIIHNGYDDLTFRSFQSSLARNKLNLPLDKKILLNIANLIEVKGHKYLIAAISNIVNIHGYSNILCLIIGAGTLHRELHQLIDTLGLSDIVKLVGYIPHEQIPTWINASDFFVLSSLIEGSPTVMFEALSCGKPFIGSNVGGIPDIINSENYGHLCNSASVTELTETIIYALKKEWEENIIEQHAAQYTWSNIAKKTVNVYLDFEN